MKKTVTISIFFLLAISCWAQNNFKTIVPQQPIVAGESFLVQYVMEDDDKKVNVRPPVFTNFRIVAGPSIYMGTGTTMSGIKPLTNTVYTLEAIRPGKFIIPGASIIENEKMIRSNEVSVTVISQKEAIKFFGKETGKNPSDYFLRPGEDPYEKIRQNLFMKVMIDKRSCYVGEPVLATFKLYSRLESKSDIVKNPGFYGFTVFDMLNLSDKQVATENINGKTFDVHTIRKVQLYPLQGGVFTVDAMQVKNKVEFSRSVVNKKTEQEIIEGVLGNSDTETPVEGTDVFETDISTEPVKIIVKPVPEKNKPVNFNGAAGHFTITATLNESNLSKNEQGFLDITISGKGNFIQLSAPAVQWPSNFEPFESNVKDDLDKTSFPLTGSRTFRYTFVCPEPGKYQISPVRVSFFDTDSNSYKTIATSVVEVLVSNEEKKALVIENPKTSIADKSEKAAQVAGIVVVLLVLVIMFYWIFRKKEPEILPLVQTDPESPTIESLMEPAYSAVSEEGKRFYSVLHGIIWDFTGQKFGLSGSEMTKQLLSDKMSGENIDHSIIENLFQVIEHCEAGMFTNADLSDDKYETLLQVKKVFGNIQSTKS